MFVRRFVIALIAVSLANDISMSQDVLSPKSVPSTRAEMLKSLDALRHREARLPLPADTSPAIVVPSTTPTTPTTPGTGSLGVVNNGRLRGLYLPAELHTRSPQAPSTKGDQLPYEFSTELFWIVSRVNNCHYCLGHQEAKLQAVGVTEQTLLELDSDWSKFPVRQAAAFKFARQLTHSPQTISDQDIEALRTHFLDQQILEIAYLIGRCNSTNRWTDSLGIPQEGHREFTTKLTASEAGSPSQVTVNGFPERQSFKDFATWKSDFEKQSTRKARLEITGMKTEANLLAHEQLLTVIPGAGPTMVEQVRNSRTVGDLPKPLRNKIAFVAGREDRAWYMQHLSRQRLLEDGFNDRAIFALGTDSGTDLADDAAIRFAKKLTVQPQSMIDDDIQDLTKHFTGKQVAEIVYHTGLAAMLNRLTEVAGLGWQD